MLTGSESLELVSEVWSTEYSLRLFGIKRAKQLATTTKTNKTVQAWMCAAPQALEKAEFLRGTPGESLQSFMCACCF